MKEESTATQTRHPWRATFRTAFAMVTSFLALIPLVATGVDVDSIPAVAWLVGVGATITRILAIPAVDSFLKTYLPFLSAEPKGE